MRADESSTSYETAHVLCMDIVEYSLQPIDQQSELIQLLQKTVRETAEYRRARANNDLISLATGDGMALVFLRDPLSPVRCAVEISSALNGQRKLRIRMGIHTGPVQRHADIREQDNVVGGGINTAQRVMDCGDAGHILLSRSVADVLEQLPDWRQGLVELGSHEVKHGLKLELYSLTKGPAGNRAVPSKLLLRRPENTTAQRSELLRHGIVFLTVFVAALILALNSEAWLDNALASRQSIGPTVEVALMFSGFYRRVLAAPRSPIPRNTVIVEIDPEHDPGSVSLMTICQQRKMIAALVSRVAEAMPSAIVIDKYFGTTASCPEEINSKLVNTFSDVNKRIPIVVGRLFNNGYLEPSLLALVPNLKDAIVNIDPDPRKLPLEWEVYPNKEQMQQKQGLAWHDTLSLAGAKAFEKGKLLERHPRLAALLVPPPRHPYISFLDPDQFQQFRYFVGYILCGREVKPGEDATLCPPAPQILAALSGKVVLIGDISSLDQHLSVVGQIPGIYMQANFIEALLDDRYYEAFPTLSYILGFVFLAGVEAILWFFRGSWIRKLSAIAVLTAALLLVLYIVIADFHLYVNPLPFIALALLIRALVMNLPYFRERARQAPAT